MSEFISTGLSRRGFMKVAGAGATALALTRCKLEPDPDARVGPAPTPKSLVQFVEYGDYKDIYRNKWVWDRVVKGTHTRANCIAACARNGANMPNPKRSCQNTTYRWC